MGGKGSILGTILGAIILGTMRNGLTLMNVQAFYRTSIHPQSAVRVHGSVNSCSRLADPRATPGSGFKNSSEGPSSAAVALVTERRLKRTASVTREGTFEPLTELYLVATLSKHRPAPHLWETFRSGFRSGTCLCHLSSILTDFLKCRQVNRKAT